jgi:hypothetical protein
MRKIIPIAALAAVLLAGTAHAADRTVVAVALKPWCIRQVHRMPLPPAATPEKIAGYCTGAGDWMGVPFDRRRTLVDSSDGRGSGRSVLGRDDLAMKRRTCHFVEMVATAARAGGRSRASLKLPGRLILRCILFAGSLPLSTRAMPLICTQVDFPP